MFRIHYKILSMSLGAILILSLHTVGVFAATATSPDTQPPMTMPGHDMNHMNHGDMSPAPNMTPTSQPPAATGTHSSHGSDPAPESSNDATPAPDSSHDSSGHPEAPPSMATHEAAHQNPVSTGDHSSHNAAATEDAHSNNHGDGGQAAHTSANSHDTHNEAADNSVPWPVLYGFGGINLAVILVAGILKYTGLGRNGVK